jgi:hypothetical protein
MLKRIIEQRGCAQWFSGLLGLTLVACGPSAAVEPAWPPAVKEWYGRALQSYGSADQVDAQAAIARALQADPTRPEVRLLAAQIALADLDYPAVLKHTDGLSSSDARGLRARARWYAGELTEAADELEQLLADPQVHDGWAEGVLQLARRGQGRTPFALKGSRLAVTELTSGTSPAMVVPLELNGQPVLGLLSTGSAEVVVDSAGSRDPSWVTLNFEKRFEVKDVPALTDDLSGISRELDRPIKVLLGVNFLRHVNATFDVLGQQFVVRTYEPPPPPLATKLPVQYVRGGGMVVRSRIGAGAEAPTFALFVDSRQPFSLALDDDAWKRTGVGADRFLRVPGNPDVRQARLSQVRLGAYDVPSVAALQGDGQEQLEKGLGIALDGRMGTGLLRGFRVSFGDAGRSLWLEDLATSLAARETPSSEDEEGADLPAPSSSP